MKAMSKTLIDRIRQLTKPMDPLPTDAQPHQPALGEIRAVVFDIYGTLFISGSGDIGLAQEDATEAAARAAFEAVGLKIIDEPVSIGDWFLNAVRQAQEDRRLEGIEYPEVEIRAIWKTILDQLDGEGYLEGTIDEDTVAALAVEYECRANPVSPMPGLAETLARLRNAGLTLGIVSNAQFFTPLLFEAFLGSNLDELGFLAGQFHRHRPSPTLTRTFLTRPSPSARHRR